MFQTTNQPMILAVKNEDFTDLDHSRSINDCGIKLKVNLSCGIKLKAPSVVPRDFLLGPLSPKG